MSEELEEIMKGPVFAYFGALFPYQPERTEGSHKKNCHRKDVPTEILRWHFQNISKKPCGLREFAR
jgi:hypothetical protein